MTIPLLFLLTQLKVHLMYLPKTLTFLREDLLIVFPISVCSFLDYFPSSNISPSTKCFFELSTLIISKFFNADFRDNGFEL